MAEVFKVVIDGLQSREDHAAINAAIQQAVATRLAGRDISGDQHKESVLLSDWRLAGFVGTVGLEAIQADLAARGHNKGPSQVKLGRFEVTIDGLDFTDDERKSIASDIQRAVLPRIAALDLGERIPTAVLRPRDWMGLVLMPLELQQLDQFRV